jgi:tetratricopeptide (TPR) repeat protein
MTTCKLALAAMCCAASATPAARVWEEKLVIPTYELGPPDPYPAWGARRPIYPYARLDTLTNRRVDKPYDAVYLENEYLKVTVLPEFGGKLYAIYDKTTKRDVLYTNHVVKYGIVAIRGAWISGGIEWNFPDGHTVTTVSRIDHTTRMEPDGSATVTVGDTERVQRMQWAVTIRLRPGWKVVETEVTLNNRREVPGRYWFWATAAAQAKQDMRFVYPMREAYPHAFWPIFSFPKYKGVDLGLYREVPNRLSLFARNSYRDFFGVYYEKSDWGVVHLADHREVAGKKTFTWGTDDSGQIWLEKLTDNDGQYVEFQAGRYETQMVHEFLAPHRVEHFTEYWFPLDRLGGGFDEATRDAALHVTPQGSQVRITANANAKFDNAVLTVKAGGQALDTRSVNLAPEVPFAVTLNLPPGAAGKPLAVNLTKTDGTELIGYRSDFPVDGNTEFKPATRPVPDPPVAGSAEQSYVAGQALDKESREPAARAAYQEALKRDPGFVPANIALAVSFYRTGEYDRAAEHLEAALRRNEDSGEAHYHLGLVRRAQNRTFEAKQELLWAARAGHRESLARFVLGEIALASGNTREALEQFSQSVLLDPRDLKARTCLAMTERIAGRLAEAQHHIEAVLRQVPIDYLALREQSLAYRASGKSAEAARASNALWKLLSREPDSILELAFDYAAAGRTGDAAELLEQAIAKCSGPVYPMLHYTLGYFYGRRGDTARAASEYALGAKGDPAFVFPHRVEEVAVLEAVRAASPNDGRAAYYLGNALAARERGNEALVAWRDAVRLDPSSAAAHRNLAWALSSVAGDKQEALAEYERAVRAAPEDFRLYLETDQILATMRATDRRIQLLTGAPAGVRSRPPVILALAAAYVEAGRLSDAAPLLEGTVFTSGEGENSGLAVFRRAHLGLAREYQRAGQHEKAAAELLRATEYPRNLGVGFSSRDSQARELIEAAREFEAAGKKTEAEALWRRAAEGSIGYPTEPGDRVTEHYSFPALARARAGRKQEARVLYTQLAALPEEQPQRGFRSNRSLLTGLGLKGLGQIEQARAALERALKMEPSNELAATALKEMGR